MGGGIDVNNPKYISFTPNQSFHTYDGLEGIGNEFTINITIDLTHYEETSQYDPTYHLVANGLDFKASLHDTLKEKQKNELSVTFEGNDVDPAFLILFFDGDKNIVDMVQVDVYG